MSVHSKGPLELIAERLRIPPSYYDLADRRYRDLGEWLEREESVVREFAPVVYPQGSFRQGTVTWRDGAYDLDLVVELSGLRQRSISQADAKRLLGIEVVAYANARGFKAQPYSGKRCWKLEYAEGDGPRFHMDLLVVVPEDEDAKQELARLIENPELAQFAVRYTYEDQSPEYHQSGIPWSDNASNPRGFGKWFRGAVEPGARLLLEKRAEELPSRAWNTPAQQVIRIIKGHRNRFFEEVPEARPSSIVITTLAARAYGRETELETILGNVVEQMELWVEGGEVKNPTNPGENFASDWRESPGHLELFRQWLHSLKRAVRRLIDTNDPSEFLDLVERGFGKRLDESDVSWLSSTEPRVLAVAPVRSRPEPWLRR